MATGVDAKLLKSTKFPPEFNQKVDMQKVNLQVMKKWIASRVTEILSNEDDVVIELIFNLIEGGRYPDIKSLQIQLTGFLDKDTPSFCKDLWKLLLSAQTSPQGVPKELLEAKKLELIQEKLIKLPKRLDNDAMILIGETAVEEAEEVAEVTRGADAAMTEAAWAAEVALVVVDLVHHPAIVTSETAGTVVAREAG
ncbi:PWI domain-containing protein [Cercophora scortea]|uniref:PWI domain-containing protein n=1 Tax=Cercophora scortea TaxID=314031 RepID=A0AAE0MLZ6_9PEZI|nr:PWI domain-containing protein [Cercophora scortea]